MKSYRVTVVYPVYLLVKASSKEKAEELALSKADYYADSSNIKPCIQECQEFPNKAFSDIDFNIIEGEGDDSPQNRAVRELTKELMEILESQKNIKRHL